MILETSEKGHQFSFQLELNDSTMTMKGKSQLILAADSDLIRRKWIEVIAENCSKKLVGAPFLKGCPVNSKFGQTSSLLPYFIPPIFHHLENKGFRMRGIWTVDVPSEFIEKGLFLINQNLDLTFEDIHTSVAILKEYLVNLPQSLLNEEDFQLLSNPKPEIIQQCISKQPAPIREFIKMLGLHFKKVIDNKATTNVGMGAVIDILGPLLIRSRNSASEKIVQEKLVTCLIENAVSILSDVHQLKTASKQKPLYRARLIKTISSQDETILDGNRNLLVNVVNEDSAGWCTVFVSTGRSGLMHASNIRRLLKEEEAELDNSGLSMDFMMDSVREQLPEIILLFDSMVEEIHQLGEALRDVSV
jgi:hypothetical protein